MTEVKLHFSYQHFLLYFIMTSELTRKALCVCIYIIRPVAQQMRVRREIVERLENVAEPPNTMNKRGAKRRNPLRRGSSLVPQKECSALFCWLPKLTTRSPQVDGVTRRAEEQYGRGQSARLRTAARSPRKKMKVSGQGFADD